MGMLDDPAMKEIVDDFCSESLSLIEQLNDILEDFEDNPKSPEILENFGQIIDRIMGAARSVEANDVAIFCELGKTIGYKSGQSHDDKLLNVVTAILFDAVDLLRKMILAIKTGDNKPLKNISTEAFASRLRWLSDKFKDIDRASCKIDDGSKDELDQEVIDSLLESLGL